MSPFQKGILTRADVTYKLVRFAVEESVLNLGREKECYCEAQIILYKTRMISSSILDMSFQDVIK